MDTAGHTGGMGREEALELARSGLDRLMAGADALRERAFGRRVELCAIINARSGRCPMDCAFCAQSLHYRTDAPVFPLLAASALRERLARLEGAPLAHVGLVTSGTALDGPELERLARMLEDMPAGWRGRVCGSLGQVSAGALERLREAGIARVHHNLETSRRHYPRICTTQCWEARRDTVLRVRAAGLPVCAGGLFGVGESWEDRVDFALSLRELGVDNVPLNFLHPHAGTPLAGQPPLGAEEALKIIALMRHILPTATLRVCGGRPLVLGARQAEMFAAGANALMTGDYLTTRGKALDDDLRLLASAGMRPVE